MKEIQNNIEDIKDENEKDKITWPKFKKYLSDNLTTVKIVLIVVTLIFLYYVWTSKNAIIQTGGEFEQSGGAGVAVAKAVVKSPFKLVGKVGKGVGKGFGALGKGAKSSARGFDRGLGKMKSGMGKLGKMSPLSGGFTMVFQFINAIFMIFGIVIILILIPTIPIIVFLVISYFICRRKLWDLRTM